MIVIKGLDMPEYENEEVFIIIKSNGEVRDNHGILLTNAQAVEIPEEMLKTMIDSYYVASNLVGNIHQ